MFNGDHGYTFYTCIALMAVISERNLTFCTFWTTSNMQEWEYYYGSFLRVVSWYAHIVRTFYGILQQVHIIQADLILDKSGV